MPATLTDPRTLEDLSRTVEETNGSSLEEFIQSLSLPSDEESTVVSSLKSLPDRGLSPSALPKNPPNIKMDHYW